MPRPIAYAICVALFAAFVLLAVVPIAQEVLDRGSGRFVTDVQLDSSQVEDRRALGPDPQALFEVRTMAIFRRTIENLYLHERQDAQARLLIDRR